MSDLRASCLSRVCRAGDGDEMGTQAEQRRLRFCRPGREQDRLPTIVGRPLLVDARKPERETFDTHELDERELGGLDFCAQLVGMMEERRREPVRAVVGVSMAPVDEVVLDDRTELRLEQETAAQAVEQRRESTD